MAVYLAQSVRLSRLFSPPHWRSHFFGLFFSIKVSACCDDKKGAEVAQDLYVAIR
jgi:hypothetical protein